MANIDIRPIFLKMKTTKLYNRGPEEHQKKWDFVQIWDIWIKSQTKIETLNEQKEWTHNAKILYTEPKVQTKGDFNFEL